MSKLYFVQIKTDNSWWSVREPFKTESRAGTALRRLVGKAKREGITKHYRIIEKDV